MNNPLRQYDSNQLRNLVAEINGTRHKCVSDSILKEQALRELANRED